MSFDEVMLISDQEMRSICLELSVPMLATAMHGTSSEIIEKFLRNIRPDLAEMTRQMMTKQDDLPEAEVAAARRNIVAIIEKSRAK